MCCPKGKCGCQYFILLTLRNASDYGGVLYLMRSAQPVDRHPFWNVFYLAADKLVGAISIFWGSRGVL
jgi:hypothetical protein